MADEFTKLVQDLPWAPKSNDVDEWRRYWMTEFQAKDVSAREHLFDGLRKAGLSA